jgi:hypothetical protein
MGFVLYMLLSLHKYRNFSRLDYKSKQKSHVFLTWKLISFVIKI